MERTKGLILFGWTSVFFSLSLFGGVGFATGADQAKTVAYSFTLKNTTNRAIEGAEFWTYAPVAKTSAQRCCARLEASQSFDIEQDELGNQVLHFRLAPLAPFASQVIRIVADLKMVPSIAISKKLPLKKKSRQFLRSADLIESDHEEIIKIADRLDKGKTLATTRKVFQWVANNVQDVGYLREKRGALYALQHKQGDCTESAYLFVALSRASGIPARAVGGYYIENNGLLRAAEYHEWAEFYHDGVWRIADPQKGIFNDQYPSYVAMQIVENKEDSTFGFARFHHSGNGLKVTMD